ncbi:diiron oxygenase [Saccharopolyspora sp. TS4A08]|uniref:Diiron oxygenase n=1 Tax=Saccharopolyspora ipomoeae TaxID=3042027 RepID=A0ABT6PI06_9PSEU|nr:diiron oxygenase [Saccharopolyspora sp. TS4A08]MDI2027628.1 diiron oxygenase [Saccharopolyspora sp. TS4A08]
MSTTTNSHSGRDRVAERLQRSSAKQSYDPDVDIDWDAPLVDGAYGKPPHRCSLYGTPLWEGLSEQQRAELSMQELSASTASGIWFELMLMQGLTRYAYSADPTSHRAHYALTEIADECRHSTMFGKAIDKIDGNVRRPSRYGHRAGKVFGAVAGPTLLFAGAIYVEELADAMQREIMRDESLQPLGRMVSRIHVLEEARHISFAKDELERAWRSHGPLAREAIRWSIAGMMVVATAEFLHPKAYTSVGLDPREAKRVAGANPHWRRTKADWARKAVELFEGMGIIGGPSKRLLRRAGLVD